MVREHCLPSISVDFKLRPTIKSLLNARAHLGTFFSFSCSMYLVKIYLDLKGEKMYSKNRFVQTWI